MKTPLLQLLGFAGLLMGMRADVKCAETKIEERKGLIISVSSVLPIVEQKLKISVRYGNQGIEKQIHLMLPTGKDDVRFFYGLETHIDERKAELLFSDVLIDAAFSKTYHLKSGEFADLALGLCDIYKIPQGWRRIELRPKGWGGYEPVLRGSITLERKIHGEENATEKGLAISVSTLLPLEGEKLKVTVRYCNQGIEKPLTLMLPDPKNKRELLIFRGLDVKVDGLPAKWILEPRLEDPAFGIIMNLKNGEVFDLTFDLADIYKLPAEWKKIEICPKPEGWGGYAPVLRVSATLERKDTTEKR